MSASALSAMTFSPSSAEHVGERRLGRRQVAQIQVTAAEHDAGGDVVGMERQAGPEQLERPGDVPVLPMHLGERRERQALGVFGVPALQLFDLAKCHPESAFRGSEVPWGTCDRCRCGEFRESSEPPPACQLLTSCAALRFGVDRLKLMALLFPQVRSSRSY